MPILLWLLGIPIPIIILLVLPADHKAGFPAITRRRNRPACFERARLKESESRRTPWDSEEAYCCGCLVSRCPSSCC
jgi:hypothetical protein